VNFCEVAVNCRVPQKVGNFLTIWDTLAPVSVISCLSKFRKSNCKRLSRVIAALQSCVFSPQFWRQYFVKWFQGLKMNAAIVTYTLKFPVAFYVGIAANRDWKVSRKGDFHWDGLHTELVAIALTDIFGRDSVRISVGTPNVLTKVFYGVSQSLQANSVILPVSGQGSHLRSSFHFIIRRSSYDYTVHNVETDRLTLGHAAA
jgi:hypothetical protein